MIFPLFIVDPGYLNDFNDSSFNAPDLFIDYTNSKEGLLRLAMC